MYYLSEPQKTRKKHGCHFFFKNAQCQFHVQMQVRHDMSPKMHDQLDRSESNLSLLSEIFDNSMDSIHLHTMEWKTIIRTSIQ